MRAIAAAALAALLIVPASLAKTKEFHTVAPISADGRVSIDSHNGTVTVLPWNQANVGIDARIEPERYSGYPEDVDKTNIKVTHTGTSVTISSDYSAVTEHFGWFGINHSLPLVHYTIHVPATAQLHVDVHNASVKVGGLHGDATLRTHNGMVEVTDYQGATDIETHNGMVKVAFANFAKPSRIETHNGAVDVAVPANTKMNLRVSGHHTSPQSDFPMTISAHGSASTSAINGGGPELRFTTHNGSLHLRKR